MSMPAPVGAVQGSFFAVVSSMGESGGAAGMCFWRFFRSEESADRFMKSLCMVEKRHDFYVVDLQHWIPLPFAGHAVKSQRYGQPLLDSIMKQEKESRVDEFAEDLTEPLDRPDHIIDEMDDCSEDEGEIETVGDIKIDNYSSVNLHVDNELLILQDTTRTSEQKYLVYSCVCPDGLQNTVNNVLAMKVWAVFSSVKLVNEFMELNTNYKMALLPENVHSFFVCPDPGFLSPDADEKYKVTIDQISEQEIKKRTAVAKFQEKRIAKGKRVINKQNRLAKTLV